MYMQKTMSISNVIMINSFKKNWWISALLWANINHQIYGSVTCEN